MDLKQSRAGNESPPPRAQISTVPTYESKTSGALPAVIQYIPLWCVQSRVTSLMAGAPTSDSRHGYGLAMI